MIPIKPNNSPFNDEQWQAIHQKGGNILVAASAGSGKTTVLIERIINQIMTGYAEVDELLVVTFTEAAAREMKERLEKRLKNGVNQSDTEDQSLLMNQLRKLNNSDIRTLHSFCLKVIQQFFYVKDMNPNFELMTDETQLLLIQRQVWEDIVARLNQDPSQWQIYQRLLSVFGDGRSDDALFENIRRIYLFAMANPNPRAWLKQSVRLYHENQNFQETDLFKDILKPYLLDVTHNIVMILTKALDLLKSCQSDIIDKYYSVLDNQKQSMELIYQATITDDLSKVIELVQNITIETWPRNNKKYEDYETINEMKILRDQAKKHSEDQLKNLFSYDPDTQWAVENKSLTIIEDLVSLTGLFMDKFREEKSKRELMDYTDLEHMTLSLLTIKDSETGEVKASVAAEYYQQHFKEILVDEYQDINDIQGEIISWLSKEYVPNSNGNLFLVGDVKQSIYGFRMAEPSLFLQKYQSYQRDESNHLILLNRNYRSRPEVLEYTNFLFERIMDEKVAEMDYTEQEFLIPGNQLLIEQMHQSKKNTQLLLSIDEDEHDDTDDDESLKQVDKEIHLIAQNISERIENKETIYDKELKKQRPLTFKDITILTSTKNVFLPVQQIFSQYNIPILSQKTENYFQRQEVQIMLALLKVIDNPMQDIPLVAVLRSYFVGLTDDDLATIRVHHKIGNYYEAVLAFIEDDKLNISDQSLKTTLHQFLNQLKQWRQLLQTTPIVDVIWQIYLETSYLDFVGGLENGGQRQANLHALYQRAVDFSNGQFKSLSGFIHYIEQIMETEQDLAEPVLIDSDQNVVRLMTVHASKGLEFPIVYIMNTNKRFNLKDAQNKIVLSKHYGMSTDYYDIENHLQYHSIIKQTMKLEQIKRLKAEEMRKLYVALTRSEQQLMIVGTIKSQEKWESEINEIQNITANESLLASDSYRRTANSWLKWIQQAIAVGDHSQGQSSMSLQDIDIHFYTQTALTYGMPAIDYHHSRDSFTDDLIHHLDGTSSEVIPGMNTVKSLLTYEYPFQLANHTSSYQSVSELKRFYEEPRIEKLSYYSDRRISKENMTSEETPSSIQGIRYTEDTFNEPRFIKDEQIQATDRGTITHYLLQLLDFSAFKERKIEEIFEEELQRLLSEHAITQSDLSLVKKEALLAFLETPVAQMMIEASEILKREHAFSFLIPAHEMFYQQIPEEQLQELGNDQLLIHGVIDSFIEYDDHLVLIDYKTDQYRPFLNATRQQQIDLIEDTYRFQMSLYREALRVAKNKPVTETYLVLLDFQEVINLTEFYDFNHVK